MSSQRFRFLIIVFAFMNLPQIADGDWLVKKSAEISNTDGFMFRITKVSGGVARGLLHLPKDSPGVFGERLPIYRVDDNRIRRIPFKKKETLTDPGRKRWISWRFSANAQFPNEELMEVMNGKEITFQYYLPDGAIYETTFSLKGAKEAIEEVFKED